MQAFNAQTVTLYPLSILKLWSCQLAGAAYKTRLNKICTKQNKCIRSMFFAHGRENVDPYNLLGILKFENIYRLKALFTNQLKNDKSNTPAVLLNILTLCIIDSALL